MINCEVCIEGPEGHQIERASTQTLFRLWHDGAIDQVDVCDEHAEDDPDGMWTMFKTEAEADEVRGMTV